MVCEYFEVTYDGPTRRFAPVEVNDTLTLDFDNREGFGSHHYAFDGEDEELDTILRHIKSEGITFGSGLRNLQDM